MSFVQMKSFEDTCYPEFGIIAEKITKGLGIKPHAYISFGAGGSSHCISSNEYSFGDNEAETGKKFICHGCKYVSRKQLEEDFEDWEAEYKRAISDGGKVEGAPTPGCSFEAKWKFEYRNGEILKPNPNQFVGEDLWHVNLYLSIQKKMPYRMNLDIVSDIDPSTDDCGFLMKIKKSRNGRNVESEGRGVDAIILRNSIDNIADNRILEQMSLQETVDIQRRFNDEYQTKKIQAAEIFSKPEILEALRIIDNIKF